MNLMNFLRIRRSAGEPERAGRRSWPAAGAARRCAEPRPPRRAHGCGMGATSPQGESRAFGSHFHSGTHAHHRLQPGRVPLRAALLILPQRSHLSSGPAPRFAAGHGRLRSRSSLPARTPPSYTSPAGVAPSRPAARPLASMGSSPARPLLLLPPGSRSSPPPAAPIRSATAANQTWCPRLRRLSLRALSLPKTATAPSPPAPVATLPRRGWTGRRMERQLGDELIFCVRLSSHSQTVLETVLSPLVTGNQPAGGANKQTPFASTLPKIILSGTNGRARTGKEKQINIKKSTNKNQNNKTLILPPQRKKNHH